MHEKLSTTGEGLSHDGSLSSLPETECDWPSLDTSVHDTSSLRPLVVEPCDGTSCPMSQVDLPYATVFGTGPPEQNFQLEPCFYQVAFLGGIEVRVAPHFAAPRTGLVLMQGEIFLVSQQLQGEDGRIYLCLADGQGWVFDDAPLVPHDPSVVQLQYTGLQETEMQPNPWCMQSVMVTGPDLLLPPPLSLPGVGQEVLAQGMLPPQQPPPPPCHEAPTIHTGPRGELLASTPAGVAITAPHVLSPISWFRVAYLGGINLRCGPSIEAPLSGFTLPQMETFGVGEELPSPDGRVYLRLCDGRGWAFDDTALMPLDPSVRRGSWTAPQPQYEIMDNRVLQEVQADALPVRRHRLHPQPRGKRGGKRCSRRSQVSSASATAAAF